MNQEKWDARFWALAQFVADWSKDPNAHVGAVLVAKRGSPVALGFNGFPVNVEDSSERLNDQTLKLDMVVHAEQNALLIAGRAAEGATLYVWGKPICSTCAGLIIQSGIARVVAEDPNLIDVNSKWHKRGLIAVRMLSEAGVKVDFRAHEVEAALGPAR